MEIETTHLRALGEVMKKIHEMQAHGLVATHLVMGRDVFKRCAKECFGPLSGEVSNELSLDGPPLIYKLPVLFHPNREHAPEVLTTGKRLR